MRAPGLLLHDYGDRCVRLSIGTAFRDLLKPAGRGGGIVVRVKVEFRHAQQASIAAARVEYAGRPKPQVRDRHLCVVRCYDAHRPEADGLDLTVSSVHLDPVSWLVGVLQHRHESGDEAAAVVLESECHTQAYVRRQRDDVAKPWL